jgi:hypothetical protein
MIGNRHVAICLIWSSADTSDGNVAVLAKSSNAKSDMTGNASWLSSMLCSV